MSDDLWEMTVNHTAGSPEGPPVDWPAFKTAVLARLDIAAEYRNLGIEFTKPVPNAKGIRECRAFGRPDNEPSAFVNVKTGVYHDSGGEGLTIDLFNFTLENCGGRFGRWIDVAKYYAEKTGVPLGHVKYSSEGKILEAIYKYHDPAGSLIFSVHRFRLPNGRKTFRQYPWRNGEWFKAEGCMDGVPLYLYRLPELIASEMDEPVWIVEGEQDVDRLRSLASGMAVTCNPMGAGKWLDEFNHWLQGRAVFIVPDNDPGGQKHAAAIATGLLGIARQVKMVVLPDLPRGGDLGKWLDVGGDIDELGRLAYLAPEWSPPTALVNGDAHAEINGIAAAVVPPPDQNAILAERPHTDLGNAERLVARHGYDLRYCHPWKSWLCWDGRRWKVDDTAEIRRRARDTVRSMFAEALTLGDGESQRELAKWSLASEKRDRIAGAMYLAEALEGVPVLVPHMDIDPWSFNCINGTINLHTGTLRPHRREDLNTKLCPWEFNPRATCPLWLATLAKFFARPDPEDQLDLIDYWQRLCGYAVVGVIRDHVLPVAYGTGNNGKSTILGAILDVLGPDYAMKSPPDMWMAKKNESHPTDRADLFGKRLVVAMETEAGRRLNETMIKEMTGGDSIRARRMREDFWEFKPTHTVMMATNHRPGVRGTDMGIWRRIRLVPFNVSVDDAEADKNMPDKLRGEASGILNWCVRGCLEWQTRGLEAPEEVKSATAGYRAEQDVLGAFLDACTLIGPAYRAKASDLYTRYRDWAQTGGEHVLTQTAFGVALVERSFEKKTSNGIWYLGIGLRAPESKPEGENAF